MEIPAVHQVESVVSLPPGLPPTDPAAPKVIVTQEQVYALLDMAGRAWPSIVKFAPYIVAWSGAIALIAGYVGSYYTKPPFPQPQNLAIVAPDDSLKAEVGALRKNVSDLADLMLKAKGMK